MSATALKKSPEPAGYAQPKTLDIPLSELLLAAEAPKGVNLVVRDSGSGSPLSDEELKASLFTNGVIVPLILKRHDSKNYVIAGNRRLRMLRMIFADDPHATVPCQDVDSFGDIDWRQIAIDSNLSLPPHIVERYEQIVLLAKDLKLSHEDARLRFGLTPRQFDQVMALGRMSETVRTAWKVGEIDAQTARAFTLEPDPKEQDKIFNAIKKTAWRNKIEENDVRSKIIPPNQRDAGKMVAFVGIETCKKAKLVKQEDLFAANHTVTDLKALTKMAADKIQAECDRLVEAGWKWAVPVNRVKDHYYYQTLTPAGEALATATEALRLADIRKIMDGDEEHSTDFFEQLEDEQTRIEEDIKARGFTPAQRAKSGCFLKIGNDGSLVIEYGRVDPKDQKSVQASERRETAKPKPKAKAGEVPLTNELAERLSEQLEKAVSASLHATPHVAAAALIAGFASSGHVIDVRAGGGSTVYASGKKAEADFAQVFEGARKSSIEALIVMLTEVASKALSIQIHSAQAKSPIDDVGLQALTAAMSPSFLNKAIKEAFDAKDYFGSVNMQACVDAVRASMGDDHAAKVAKMKKADAAKFAAANVPGTGWLPKQLRTVHYKGPLEKAPEAKPKAAKKDKKPKPVKKAPAKKKKR